MNRPLYCLPDGKGSVKRVFAMLVIRNLHPRKEEEKQSVSEMHKKVL